MNAWGVPVQNELGERADVRPEVDGALDDEEFSCPRIDVDRFENRPVEELPANARGDDLHAAHAQ